MKPKNRKLCCFSGVIFPFIGDGKNVIYVISGVLPRKTSTKVANHVSACKHCANKDNP